MPGIKPQIPHQSNRSGRPAAESSGDVRAAILDVAQDLFARQGYAATPVRNIATAAGVTPAMIHYYFGSKAVLLRTVLERAVEPLAEAIETLKATSEASPDFIVRTLMSTIARHPGLPYLVLREVMLPGGTMQAHFAGHLAPRLGGALPDILDTLQRREEIRDDPPPATAALILLSLVMFPFIVRPIAEQVLGVGLHGDALESFQDHVAAFVQRGFLP